MPRPASRIARPTLFLAIFSLLSACSETTSVDKPVPAKSQPKATPTVVSERQVLFGDVHLHSRWSFDAFSLNVAVGPDQAYRFAKGEAIDHISGGQVQLDGPPLDFMALTEHSEYMGVSRLLEDENAPIRSVDLIARLTSDDPAVRGGALGEFARSMRSGEPVPALVADEVIKPAWQRLQELANEHNEPGVFTAFIGYEWTSAPIGNLHRNIIFRGSDVPDRPFSAFDSIEPEDLWTWLDNARLNHSDVIAIPHNANLSDGNMYPLVSSDGNPIDTAWAQQRNRNEPVTEMMQIKGFSETHPVLSPEDEWADFEIFHRSVNNLVGDQVKAKHKGSYVRDALKEGLRLEPDLGTNPYRMGMIASTDGHNASAPFEEANYFGKLGVADGTFAQRLTEGREPFIPDVVARWSAAGLAAVWAESNTRESIFDAMRRREAYATSGTRITVRFFGGDLADAGYDVAAAYKSGVPMGGELRAAHSPTFVAWAARDALSAPLDRVQVVKGWMDKGEMTEAVIDIACASGEPTGNPARCPVTEVPSAEDCSALLKGDGAPELRATWKDPGFDPSEAAFYYVRVLETHTCRWTTYQAREMGIPIPDYVPTLIQERAVTSPIWYRPTQ